MNPSLRLWLHLGCAVCLGLAVGGCDSHPPLATVSGTVSRDDEPLAGLRVIFLPDPSHDTLGAHASGVTDEAGNYVLTYRGDQKLPGAVLGWHKVIIEDFAAENRRDPRNRSPVRVPPMYRLASSTPLDAEVQPGDQTIDFQVETE